MELKLLTRLLYSILDHMTPLAWQSATVAVLSTLSVLAIWQASVLGTELFRIFITMLLTGLVGMIGLVYRRMNDEIIGNRQKIEELQRRQKQMLQASLRLWASNFPEKAAEAVAEYHKAIEEDS